MGNKLLLADDSITIQKVVAIIFANEEFELTVVDNGIAALEKAREVRPDVMLVDALMPGKSGYEVCTELRRDPALSSVPILLLIGAFEPFDESKARECGADSSITKPFESQQLIDRVKELLELGKTRKAAPAPAAPAPHPVPVESAAEELWGDLSSFDTMPPPNAPVAPVAPVAPPVMQAQPAAPFAPPPEPAAAPVFAAPAPAAPAPQPQPEVALEEIQEASYEDDLWGAFELEEIPASAAPSPAASAAAQPEPEFESQFEPEFEAEEFFSFDDDSDTIEETGPALGVAAAAEPERHPSAEELFSLVDEEPLSLESASEPDPFNFPAEEPFSFEPEADSGTPATAPLPEAAEPFAAATPAFEEAQVAPPREAPQAAAAPVGAISEADLVAALSRVSREVIERIVWEVVPDLAEVLIKEEIRKLRAGVKG